MIYTVTFNPALDYIVRLDSFTAGQINRVNYEQVLGGGKGINVSIVLGNMGIKSTALGFLAGFTGITGRTFFVVLAAFADLAGLAGLPVPLLAGLACFALVFLAAGRAEDLAFALGAAALFRPAAGWRFLEPDVLAAGFVFLLFSLILLTYHLATMLMSLPGTAMVLMTFLPSVSPLIVSSSAAILSISSLVASPGMSILALFLPLI